MSITTEAQAPPPAPPSPAPSSLSAADTARAAADFLDQLAPEAELATTITAGLVDIQIPLYLGTLPERRAILTAAAGYLLDTTIETRPYDNPDLASWGSLHAAADWHGVRVDIWTALSRLEARAAGLATCAGCGHRDHDSDVACLAAGYDTDGIEAACACGAPEDAPLVPTAAAYDHDWRAQIRDDEAWEARRDADRDAWAERCEADAEARA